MSAQPTLAASATPRTLRDRLAQRDARPYSENAPSANATGSPRHGRDENAQVTKGSTRPLEAIVANATFAVGDLVRVRNASSAFHEMTGTVVEFDSFVPSVRWLRMTSTGHVLRFNVAELRDARGAR